MDTWPAAGATPSAGQALADLADDRD